MSESANPLTELSLGLLGESGHVADTGGTQPGPVADKSPTHPTEQENNSKIRLSFVQFLDSQDQKYRHLLAESAWICVSCETINGVDTKGRIRKTCLKCRKPRGISKEVISLILEGE